MNALQSRYKSVAVFQYSDVKQRTGALVKLQTRARAERKNGTVRRLEQEHGWKNGKCVHLSSEVEEACGLA